MVIIAISEATLSVDEFNNPKVYKNTEAILLLLTRLILLNPGTIQSHPDMGVGIVERYRYSLEGSEIYLKEDIAFQIAKYLPKLQGVNVNVEYKDHSFYISITVNDYLYLIMYDNSDEANALKTKYIKLSEL